MKINTIILSLTLSFVALTSLVTCSNYRIQSLRNRFTQENLFSPNIQYQDVGLSLNGNSLVLYNVTHAQYVGFNVRRLQLENTHSNFRLILKGLQGSLISYFQEKTPFSIEDKVFDYNPGKDLLNQPLLTLAILGYDILNADVYISVTKTTPNQITCDITFKEQGIIKAHFSAKFKPTASYKTMWDNLKQQPIPVRPTYLDPELKQRLDAYTSSKQLPFITEESLLNFSLLQK